MMTIVPTLDLFGLPAPAERLSNPAADLPAEVENGLRCLPRARRCGPWRQLFPGLQSRYPAAHGGDEEPTYVVRDAMTAKDVAFNIKRLRREGKTKLGRADALEAWWETRSETAAPAPR